jgi:predicted AlkP superfamily phosphohydrolase/phosphomutase
MTRARKLIMIGLDAADPHLIENGMADGTLRELARLRGRGAYGRLSSPADWLVGSPWPSFYTSTSPADHGFYHYLTWRPERMAVARPSQDWLPLTPFWREAPASECRVVAIDMPLTYAPEQRGGVEISGWASHDLLVPPYVHPKSLCGEVQSLFGAPPRADEKYDLMTAKEVESERDVLIRGVESLEKLAAHFLETEAWDLFLLAIGATHRGGHRLWDPTAIKDDAPVEPGLFENALRRVYKTCDAAVGRLIESLDEPTTVFVFSLHGMGPNTCRTEILPEMLSLVLSRGRGQEGPRQQPALLKRLRDRIPTSWRHRVKSSLPAGLQDALTAFWRLGGVDWSKTPAVSLVADLQGYVRVNLRGRERDGIVEPGKQYDELCEQIGEGLRTFRDADTGRPVVHRVERIDKLFTQGRRLSYLPDLVIQWDPTPVAAHRMLEADRFGTVAWPTPGRNFTGRSGNHRPQGFLLAAGPGITPGSDVESAGVLDLAPSALARLGLEPPKWTKGKAIRFA